MRDAVPSRTAEAVCFCRAAEALRPSPIVRDPHAAVFLRPPYRAALAACRLPGVLDLIERRTLGLMTYVLARHRFIDDALAQALPRLEQVLVLGAGYDTRALRFADRLGDRPVFEVDHPATQARKRRRMEGAGLVDQAVRVPVDFRSQRLPDRLHEAGFVAGRPTFVAWEGVSMYLTEQAVRGTLSDLRALCGPGSELVMDFAWPPHAWLSDGGPPMRQGLRRALRAGHRLLRALGEPITFGVEPEQAPAFLGQIGWDPVDQADPGELQRRHVPDGRGVVPLVYLVRATDSGSSAGAGSG